MDAPKEVEDGLYDLVRKSGVPIDRKIFKILLNLINMNCDPMVIYYILKHPLGQISAPYSRPAGVNRQSNQYGWSFSSEIIEFIIVPIILPLK
ncbi:hypothetical protein ACTXT7_016993, partial [Hymenolepis weldensis]